MKIDNIDNIVNKEKSPDKAERTTSIEDIKKTQSKFFDFPNDLATTTANCGNNNSLLDGTAGYDCETSKLKKLLLNSNPEVANLNELNINNGTIATSNGVKSEDRKDVIDTKPPKSEKQKLFLCSECNEYFLKLHLFNHMKCFHNKFTCLYCYGFFEKVEKLQLHLVRKHKVQNTTIGDEQTLKECFSGPSDGDKVINAVCCKCASILDISENNFHTHNCGGSVVSAKTPALNSKRKNSHSVAVQQQTVVENSLSNNHRNSISAAKEDLYCEQAIQQLLHQEPSNPTPRTTFNGALSELSSQNINVPPLISNATHDTTPSSANTSTSSMSWHEQSSQQQQGIVNNNNNNNTISSENNKMVVPKLTLKIPKAAFNHQYDNIESDEDSGDENSDSEQEESEESGSENDEKRSSSLSENDDKENEVRRPENLPILKLKFKNLSSTPELVHDNNASSPPPPTSQEADVDLSKCPMDLEPEQQQKQQQQLENELPPEVVPEEPKKIIIDGVVIKPADEDIRPHEINLDESLDKIDTLKFMKICLRASFPYCLYCNHARKIVVNGKSLAIHFITHHRFHAMVDSITAEELHPEKIVNKLEASVDELKPCYFNLDTYDDHDEEKREGHVTISHEKLYECFQCRFQTPIHKELYLHNRKMHAKSPINCLMCKMSFYSYSELLCHICPGVPNKREYNDFKYYCCLCNMTNIPSAFRLMVHLRKQHFACDVCLEKCSDQGKLSSHIWKHKLMHICFRCHVFYQNKADIMKHLFWKHGTEGIECKKCLQKKWPHVYHFCSPPAVFQCPQCEMSFSKAMALKIHVRTHEEDGAKYACQELGCEKKFISKKLLLRHLERHQSETAALENGEQERSAEGTVIIPKEIPDGFCTRTLPVVFKRFTKKPPVRRIEETKPEEKVEEVKKEETKEAKKLPDLPETKLNLSESSDSDSSSDDEGKKPTVMPLTQNQKSNVPSEKKEKEQQQTSQLKKTSSLTDSDTDDQMEKEEKANPPNMQNIMENLKSFQESQQQPSTNPQDDTKTEKVEEDIPDKLPENPTLHVCQSDHDYSKMWRPAPGTTADDLEDMIKVQKIDKDKNKKKDKKSPQKAKKKSDDFSSSDSSSGSSSDSSSGTSSGSSSSGSSSSTSDSSSSEASSLNTSKPRTKKFTKKRSKKEKKLEQEIPEEPEIPRDPDDLIYESDLLTDETETDEDFYDEHPLKINQQINEKRKELGLVEGIIENSRPSTPSLPPDEVPKIKIKKRKHKKSMSSPSKRQRAEFDGDFSPVIKQRPSQILTSTPIPKIELHQANQIRQLLQSTQQQPVLPILKEQQQHHVPLFPISTPINVSRVTSAASSRMNSGDESGIKRSQRKRVPNKFYGYTSDDDSMAVHIQLNDPFKPIPPPNLTWRKEDLPSRSKSPPKVAPLKLNLTEPPQIYHDDVDLSTKQLPVSVNHVNNARSDDTASSDDDNQLFISETRKRKRKTQSQSMYAFHTLETPPTVSQPPIPRLKLTIGSNNKIRRRNINPLKPPPKKRKIAATSSRPSFNPRQFDTQLPARILQSPPPVQEANEPPMTSKKAAQEHLDKQQKLEVAIQNTQLYFQRYNHAQIGNSDMPSEATNDDGREYCYCRRAYNEQHLMIGCDGENCQIEWFHFECVGILMAPRGKWYCPECQKEQKQAF